MNERLSKSNVYQIWELFSRYWFFSSILSLFGDSSRLFQLEEDIVRYLNDYDWSKM
jgi:hypothetical protein